MATTPHASNVIPFRRPRPKPHKTLRRVKPLTKKQDREILACIIEEHVCHLEHSTRRLRTLLSEWKALEGWKWQHPIHEEG